VAKGMWNVYEQPRQATKEKTTSYGGAGVEGEDTVEGRKEKEEGGIGWEKGRGKERDNTRKKKPTRKDQLGNFEPRRGSVDRLVADPTDAFPSGHPPG
jgi:hypothetical protein